MLLVSTIGGLDGGFVLSAMLLAVLVGQVLQIWMGILRGKAAERRSVSFEGVPLEKAEFEKHATANDAHHRELSAKIGLVEQGLRAEVRADMDTIRRDIKAVEQSVSGLAAATNLQNQALARIESKVDRRME